VDAIEDVEDFASFDLQAGFLADFAGTAMAKGFADFKGATGDGPLALERFGAALHDGDTALMDDDRADTNDGAVGIVAFDGSCQLSALS